MVELRILLSRPLQASPGESFSQMEVDRGESFLQMEVDHEQQRSFDCCWLAMPSVHCEQFLVYWQIVKQVSVSQIGRDRDISLICD